MNKQKLTENKAEATPTGGVLVGKRDGQTMIHNKGTLSGYLVGRTHAEGGIKAVNKSTGQPLEMQGGEVVITAPAVSDNTKREFEGKMMTNREILSEINKRGGGVSFADGGDIPTEMHFSGNSYKYGGKTVTDHEIAYEISKCGCEHGGHLSKGMSLKQIAKMHGVTLLELNRQVKMGLDAESEHTPKVTEQMKIVKDHLYENPNYYSLLKKAGLKKGGQVKENLVKNAKSGNSPSRDLNNYNDLMDVQADGAVGGDSGIYANGGRLGTSGLPLVDYIVIINGGSHLKGLRSDDKYYDFQSLKKRVAEEYKLLPASPIYRGYIEAQAYDTEGNALATPNTYISDMKNTVKNFNPYTGKPSDLEKSFAKSRPVSFKKYDWSEWFSGKKSMPSTQVPSTLGSKLVTGLYISYTNPTNNSVSSFTVDNASEFLYTLINLYKNSIKKIDYKLIIDGKVIDFSVFGLVLSDDPQDNWRTIDFKMNPNVTTVDDVAYRLKEQYDGLDLSKFIGRVSSSTTAQPSTSTTSNLVEVPDNDPNFDKLVKSLPPPILGLLMIRALEQGISVDNDTLEQKITLVKNKIDGKIFAFSDSQEGGLFWSEISKGRFTEFKRLYGKYGEKVKDIKINIPTTAQPNASITSNKPLLDLAGTKIWIGDNPELSRRVQERAIELGFDWGIGGKTPRNLDGRGLYFGNKNDISYTNNRDFFSEFKGLQEIFESDIFGSGTATTQPTATSTSGLIEIPDSNNNFDGKVLSLPSPILELLAFRIKEQNLGNISKIFDMPILGIRDDNKKLFEFDKTPDGFSFWSNISKGDFKKFKEKYGKYGEKVKDIVGTPTTSSGKFTSAEIKLFEGIDDIVKEFNLSVKYPILELYPSPYTKDFDLVNEDTGEVFYFRSEDDGLGVQKADADKDKSTALLKDYLDWKSGKSTSATSTSTAQPTSSKFTKGENDMFQQVYDYVSKNDLRVVDVGLTVTTNTEFIPFIDEETNTRHFALKFQDALAFDKNSAQDKEFIKKYLEWLQEKQSGISTATTATQTQPTAPLTEEQKIASEFVADDSVLRRNDILGSASFQSDRNDLDALTKLLPSFQQSKFSNEKASILKEMARIQKKLDYKGFIASNEEVSKGKDLFTPQGLLNYYFTQATQNPTAELQPPCELPTPNGAKSKLPLSAYLNVRSSQFKKWFGDWEKAYETDNYVNCSKMIDEETKEPKIFYHGVRKYIPSFGQMSNMGVGVVRPYGSFEPPNFPASYFANNESYANFYGGIAENMPKPSEGYKPFIYKVFLSIKNPISLLPLDFEVSYRDLIDYILVAYGVRLSINSVLLKQLGDDMDKKHPMWIYIRRDIGLIEMLKDYGYDALIQQGDIPVFDKSGNVVEDRSKYIKDIEYLSFYPNQVKSATVKKSFYFNFFNDIRFKKGGYVRI